MNGSKINPTMTPEVQAVGESIADVIAGSLPPGHGFALLIFEFGHGGNVSWISNAERDGLVAAMKDVIAKLEGRVLDAPERTQ